MGRIANAGIAQVKPLLDLTEEEFENMFRVNVFGVQNCYQAAAKQLIKQGNCKPETPGKIIGVSPRISPPRKSHIKLTIHPSAPP